LATNDNFQVEGTTTAEEFLIYKYGKIAVSATSIHGQKDYYFTQNKIGGLDFRVRNTSTTGSSFAQICAEIENNSFICINLIQHTQQQI
jgi:uracil DNA glycosylase